MLVIIEGVAMPPDEHGQRLIQLYCYTREEAGREASVTDVRDARHAKQIQAIISGETILDGTPPRTKDHQQLFFVSIHVSNTRGGTSGYRAMYHKFQGCPLNAASLMMDIYKAVKKNLRVGLESLRERKKAKGKTK